MSFPHGHLIVAAVIWPAALILWGCGNSGPSAKTVKATEHIFEMAAWLLEGMEIHNGGQCLESDMARGALVRNACKSGQKSQQFSWVPSAEGDTMRSLGADKCVTLDSSAIPGGGGCPPKDTPLKFRSCDVKDAYQKWRFDDHRRIVLQPCPDLCMVDHSKGWVYAQSQIFAWPCKGATVPFSLHTVRVSQAAQEHDTGRASPRAAGEDSEGNSHSAEVDKTDVSKGEDTQEASREAEEDKKGVSNEASQKYTLRRTQLFREPHATLAFCASVSIVVIFALVLASFLVAAENSCGCRCRNSRSAREVGWMAVPTQECELTSEDVESEGQRMLLCCEGEQEYLRNLDSDNLSVQELLFSHKT